MTHPSHRLWAEVVRICSELHWSLDTVLDLEHPVRRQVLDHVAAAGTAPRSLRPGGE